MFNRTTYHRRSARPSEPAAHGLEHYEIVLLDAAVRGRRRERQRNEAADVLPWPCTVMTHFFGRYSKLCGGHVDDAPIG